MTRPNATRDAWHPTSRQDSETVLLELQDVIASPHFSNSKRYPALLRYIVEKTLAGESDHLKERTLGVEVFERPVSYDTNTDTVVRYTAGEVRKRLSLYYHELGHKPRIQISLPAGSYIPEFVQAKDESEDPAGHLASGPVVETGLDSPSTLVPADHSAGTQVEVLSGPMIQAEGKRTLPGSWRLWLTTAVAVVLLAGVGWFHRSAQPRTALDQFWLPVLRDQRVAMICTGGAVFAQNNYSGVTTAGKNVDYPFVSLQAASAIAQISALLERNGVTTGLLSAPTTSLTQLVEHPVILLGGYNNQWTLRLLQPLRFHFAPQADASIVDSQQPQVRWVRDQTLPYSSADDYALIARFRDSTTGSWVIVLAGVGRNGSEAAAQFVSTPHYMQLLRDQIGSDFSNRNVEAVLKVSVIDGKTGAPSLVAVHTW